MKLELLVHISAPTSYTDDERYRRLAEAADDFEAMTRINCTAQEGDHSLETLAADVNENAFVHQAGASMSGHRVKAGKSRNTLAGATASPSKQPGNERGLGPKDDSLPLVETKGKTPIRFAVAPDFGSFTSTSRTPIQQLDENERRWFQQQSSSKKRPLLSRKRLEEVSAKGSTPEFIGDTQQALAALIDHIPHSSLALLDSDPTDHSSFEEPSQKRRCLSPEHENTRNLDMPKASLVQPSTDPRAGGPRADHLGLHPPDTPVRGQTSQLRDSYGLSNSHSQSSTKPQGSWPDISVGASVSFELPLHGSQQSQTQRDENGDIHCPTSVSPNRSSQQHVESTADAATAEGNGDSKNFYYQYQEPSTQSKGFQKERSPQTAAPGRENVEAGHDFASLPLEHWFPPPQTAKKESFNALTEILESFTQRLDRRRYFKPLHVSRPIKDDERGYWIIETGSWKPKYQFEFWTQMEGLITSGGLGAVWCQRNRPKDWTLKGTDGKENEGLGTVWVFCWGQVVIPLWLTMLVHSHRQIQRSQAQWVVGSPEDLEVVVRMP